MKCPYCGHLNIKVIDSRLNKDNTITRRRRTCIKCKQRFTTYERIEVMLPMLVKKNGRREAWNRGKIVTGLGESLREAAGEHGGHRPLCRCHRRPPSGFWRQGGPHQPDGEWVMEALPVLDEVAYLYSLLNY